MQYVFAKKVWFIVLMAGFILMVFVGGLTRLTDSGLSITRWEPITGIVPPITQDSWQAAFQEYKKYPEYNKVKFSMSLSEFKFIYYMEYFHRLLGRILGLVGLIPFFLFLFLRAVTRKEFFQYSLLLSFLGFQGFLGWYMVKSGLIDNPDVSHYRLTLHFISALILISISYWYFLGCSQRENLNLFIVNKPIFFFLGVILFLQIVLGCFMSGLDAGYVSNTFPKMFDCYIPPGLFYKNPWYLNLLENTLTIHFFHRFFGILLLLMTFFMWFWTGHISYFTFFIFCIIQVLLGVLTIVSAVPIYLASIHQMFSICLVLSYVHYLYEVRRGNGYIRG